MSSVAVTIGGEQVLLRRVQLAGPVGFLIDGPRGAHAGIGAALEAAGATRVGELAWQSRRIEAGWPLYGVDITDKNLPQELDRDRLAINFTKGCYLGQETVARIDALGHVNKILVGVRFRTDEVPPTGTELSLGEQVVGHVTSACFSPLLHAPLALAYVRRGENEPGTSLVASTGPAEIVRLPLPETPSS
jgi:folate-binding protein YgfZ